MIAIALLAYYSFICEWNGSSSFKIVLLVEMCRETLSF